MDDVQINDDALSRLGVPAETLKHQEQAVYMYMKRIARQAALNGSSNTSFTMASMPGEHCSATNCRWRITNEIS